ncbi:Crp/Fnr family transcriptional regulator [Lyngbya confervoides]|uniref:Crp/Fnr family transcriptional regulator n=1 Tax=Lyngbya confervoides BDU141951 TaxID=1574623 RepID=A0ABD4T3H6_9CYAN|nr:Crp/Fnr family transcriptional regulator [Lyngbya confervoides]MCM1983229.1 Crp/Fnr family transcriptional regulator [Lyngbya confervoides BDU141951]
MSLSTLSETDGSPPSLAASLRKFDANQKIHHSPHSLWLVHSGIVKTLCIQPEGYVTTLGYWGTGDLIGGPIHEPADCEMICVTPVSAECISLHVDSSILSALMAQIATTNALLAIQGIKQVNQRLQQGLLWLAHKFGQDTRSGCLIACPLTQDALAELIGTTRVTITRLLKELTQLGYIQRSKKMYTLTPNALHTQDWFGYEGDSR